MVVLQVRGWQCGPARRAGEDGGMRKDGNFSR